MRGSGSDGITPDDAHRIVDRSSTSTPAVGLCCASSPPSASTQANRDKLSLAVFLYGATTGGATRRALTLAREFAVRGHAVDLVLVNPNCPLDEGKKNRGWDF